MNDFAEHILRLNPAWPLVWFNEYGVARQLGDADCDCKHPEDDRQAPCQFCRDYARAHNGEPPQFFVHVKGGSFQNPRWVEVEFVRWEGHRARVTADEPIGYSMGYHGGEFAYYDSVLSPDRIAVMVDGTLHKPVRKVGEDGRAYIEVEKYPGWSLEIANMLEEMEIPA